MEIEQSFVIATLQFSNQKDWEEFQKEHIEYSCSDMDSSNSMTLLEVRTIYREKDSV